MYLCSLMKKGIMLLLSLISMGAQAQTNDTHLEDTLQEVSVSAVSARQRLKEVQIGVEKVNVTTLSKVPALFGEKDIIKGIQLLPGVKTESEASGGYQVRGGTAAQNLILFDGATVYNAGHLMGLFSTFNDETLSNAALYKGLMPAQIGGATSSVFDIDMRTGDLQRHHIGATIGLLSAKFVAEGPIQTDRSSYLVAARRSYLDVFLKATEKYRDDELNFYDVNAKLNFRLTDRDRLGISFFRGRDNMGVVDLADMHWHNMFATANWLHTFNDRLYANTRLIYSDFLSDMGIDLMNTYYTLKGFIRHLTLRHNETWMPAEGHRINAGFESSYMQLESAEWDINYLHQREKRDAWTNALWVNEDWHIKDHLDLSAGMRLKLFSVLGGAPYYQIGNDGTILETMNPASGSIVKTYIDAEPRVSMKWTINEQNNLKIGYSRTSQDVHAILGNTMSVPFNRYTMTSNIVKPEVANQVAVGWTGMTRDAGYDFSAETYYKQINNVYDYRDGKSFFSEIEIERLLLGGEGRAYGLELCAHKNTGALTGWLSYTLSWAENKIAGINGGSWYTATNDRRHDFVAVGIYHLSPTWELTGSWRYTTGQSLTAPSAKYEIDGQTYYYYAERNGYRAPAHHRLDVGATHTKRLSRYTRIWSFGIFNAYCRYNPFVITFENDDKRPSGTKVMQTSLFGIVPSVSLTIKY